MAVSKISSDARDDRYEVRLYNPVGGGRHKKVVRGKRAAELHEAQMRLQIDAGGVAIPGLRTITFAELMEHVLAARPNLAANTIRSYRNTLRLHLYPTLGGQQVRKLTSGQVLQGLLARIEQQSGREARRAAESLLRLLLKDRRTRRRPVPQPAGRHPVRATDAGRRRARTGIEAAWRQGRPGSAEQLT